MKKTSKEGWLKSGLNALSNFGEEAIRIDKLCSALDVSKGSFYHHFKNIDDYVLELMKFWGESKTADIIKTVENEADFNEKVEKLNDLVIHEDHLVEVRIRAWGIRNKDVCKMIQKIDQTRMEYLKSLYIEMGFNEKHANDFARLEYASFVGMQHLFRDLPTKEKSRLSQLFHQLIKNKL